MSHQSPFQAALGSQVSPDTRATAIRVARENRVAVFIVAYNAERHIENVLRRIPSDLAHDLAQIYVIDDASSDNTYDVAVAAGKLLGLNLITFRTPNNRGYGGNQKIGYRFAESREFDIVVLLHGDGQYAPESLFDMLAPFAADTTDVVLGSRMLYPRDALRGGMPLYKWVGNQVLTAIENAVLHTSLSEFHTGYRAYRIRRLHRIPYSYNSDGFHFDTEVLIQLLSAGATIREVPIPTSYGDEVCHVPGPRYALSCIKAVLKYRLFRLNLFYDPFLDCSDEETYVFKTADTTVHQYVLRSLIRSDDEVLDLGAAKGHLSARVAETAREVVAVDRDVPREAGAAEARAVDLNGDFGAELGGRQFTKVLALDVIEHMHRPEEMVEAISALLQPGGTLVASTANVGFFIPRLMLLGGHFNYGKRGILDMTHTRLFTVRSFRRLLEARGFDIEEVRGFGPPIHDLVSGSWSGRALDRCMALLARVWPSLFAYQCLVTARRRQTVAEVVAATIETGTGTVTDRVSAPSEKQANGTSVGRVGDREA